LAQKCKVLARVVGMLQFLMGRSTLRRSTVTHRQQSLLKSHELHPASSGLKDRMKVPAPEMTSRQQSLTAQAAPHVQHLLIGLQVEHPAKLLQRTHTQPATGGGRL
jgi:hypothetical protein